MERHTTLRHDVKDLAVRRKGDGARAGDDGVEVVGRDLAVGPRDVVRAAVVERLQMAAANAEPHRGDGRLHGGLRFLDRPRDGGRRLERFRYESNILAVLQHPTFGVLFGPDSQAEVPIVAEIPRPGGKGLPLRLNGQIDRLARIGHEILIIDYKTNRPPPREATAVAEVYLLQLAAYRLALCQIFAGHSVKATILWTDGARLMEIPAALLDAAEARLWRLDPARPEAAA